MSRIVDDLLLLAKLEQPDFLRPEPVEVEPLHRTSCSPRRRHWSTARLAAGRRAADGTVVADPQRLTQAVHEPGPQRRRAHRPDADITLGSQRRSTARCGFWVRRHRPGHRRSTSSGASSSGSPGAATAGAAPTAPGWAWPSSGRSPRPTAAGSSSTAARRRAPASPSTHPGGTPPDHRAREIDMARILIAEDEARIASFLEKGLRANGFTHHVVDDGVGRRPHGPRRRLRPARPRPRPAASARPRRPAPAPRRGASASRSSSSPPATSVETRSPGSRAAPTTT